MWQLTISIKLFSMPLLELLAKLGLPPRFYGNNFQRDLRVVAPSLFVLIAT